jgi:hypothetical protein
MQDGSRAIAERKKQGFHYSDIPTAEYRARFGFLGYSCKEGTAVFLSGEPLAYPRDKVVTIPGEDAKPRYLPPALLKAGQAEATAVVHPYFARSPWLAQAHLLTEREIPLADRRLRWPQSEAQRPIYWPAESGGQTTLEKIFERFEQMHRPEWGKEMQERVERFSREKGWPAGNEELAPSEDPTCDPVLQKLIEPEQQRQWAEMLKAIDRVCALIQPGGP